MKDESVISNTLQMLLYLWKSIILKSKFLWRIEETFETFYKQVPPVQ